MYTYVCMYVCMYIYIYIYIHIHARGRRFPSRWAKEAPLDRLRCCGKKLVAAMFGGADMSHSSMHHSEGLKCRGTLGGLCHLSEGYAR